jgi:hypothetical protein
MKKRLTLLVQVVSLTNFVFAQSTNDVLFNYGPKNKADQKFVTLYVVRPDDTLDKKRWYSLMYEKTSLGAIGNNSKTQIQFALDGKKRFWTQLDNASPTSGISMDLEYGKSYYLKLQLTPGLNHANPELLLLDSLSGKEELNKITGKTRNLLYPVPPNISEGMLVGNPFNRNLLIPYYYNTIDSFYYWRYRFKAPAFFHYFFISEKRVYQFVYSNPLLSPTYSEFITVLGSNIKEMKDESELLNYVKKSLNDGKGTKNKKQKLVSLNYEPLKTSIGDFGWMALSEVEDHEAADKGNNDYLLLREVRACIYVDTKEKNKVLMIIWLSCRGTPEEIYNLDEMKERLTQFLSGWEPSDPAKILD